jgi:hypothetical protein
VNREFHPHRITSPPGDKFHPWGTTSPLGSNLSPRGEVKNGPQDIQTLSSPINRKLDLFLSRNCLKIVRNCLKIVRNCSTLFEIVQHCSKLFEIEIRSPNWSRNRFEALCKQNVWSACIEFDLCKSKQTTFLCVVTHQWLQITFGTAIIYYHDIWSLIRQIEPRWNSGKIVCTSLN